MIQDLDSTLRALLIRELPQYFAENALPNRVTISFETPDDQFPPTGVSLPAVDFFLYDVRENLELRSNEWSLQRDSNGSAQRQPPPVRIDCSYLITAWASEGSNSPAREEHALLGEVMIALLRFPKLPEDVLQERLRGQRLPLPTAVLQPGHLQSVGEFWQALGGKPKAALNYKITVAVQPFAMEDVPLVIESSAAINPVATEGPRA
jgi:hypothetical protein